MTAPPITPGNLTEKQLAGQVTDLARTLNWRRYHTYRSTRSEPGFPDEVLVRERVVWLELKTVRGKLSGAQASWLLALLDAGQEAYIVRPDNLDDLGRVLAHRGDPWGRRSHVAVFAARLLKASRVECEATLRKRAA